MTENNAAQPGQDPLFEAIDILTVAADELRHSHALGNSFDDWTGEPEAKAEYDRTLRVVAALSKLRAEGVQAGDERTMDEAWNVAKAAAINDYGTDTLAHRYLYPAALASAPVAGEAQKPVGRVRHFNYSGVARNGFSQEAVLNDDAPTLPDGTLLYAAPQASEAVRDALEALTREAQAVADDYHRPRYTRLDEAIQSARAALSTPSVVKQSLTATQTGEKGEKDGQ